MPDPNQPADAKPERKFPTRTVVIVLLVLLLLLAAWLLLSRKDAPPAEAGKPLAEFAAPTSMTIALCPGLQIVTAISQKDGDYESIKTVEAVTDKAVRIRYSSENRVKDIFATDDGQMKRMTVNRTVLKADLENAIFYAQRYFENMPETIPESTAIGTSAAVLRDLKSEAGAAKLNISNAYSGEPGIDRDVRPSVYDYVSYGTLQRVASQPMEVLVDDRLVLLPTVKAKAEFIDEAAEFTFLDDVANPLTLAFQTGIRNGHAPDKLDVVKINHPCALAANTPAEPDMAAQLATRGRVAVYDIHFAFGTGEIREESVPRMKELAGVMQTNPSWRIKLEGHTDTVGDAAANLTLSARRAETLKAMLVSQFGVAAERIETAGLGGAHPRDSNDTVQGRARNRRIEIQRL